MGAGCSTYGRAKKGIQNFYRKSEGSLDVGELRALKMGLE